MDMVAPSHGHPSKKVDAGQNVEFKRLTKGNE